MDLIAVSVGPGSYTGIRVGLSTALGFKRATASAVEGVSALKAIAVSSGLGECTVVVPIGRGRIAAQRFGPNERQAANPYVVATENLIEEIRTNPSRKFILRKEIVDMCEKGMVFEDCGNVEIPDVDLAVVIGLYAAAGREGSFCPLYL
jgi:tRNA threonylcarbamoyladenosine biosynthesis protein TsaB